MERPADQSPPSGKRCPCVLRWWHAVVAVLGLAAAGIILLLVRAGSSSALEEDGASTEAAEIAPRFDPDRAAAVIRSTSALMYAMYSDVVDLATELQAAVDRFVASPTAENLEACKAAWRRARPFYIQTEVGRFYEGPIDLVEIFINAWPVDEAMIDYVAGKADAGIINHPTSYPVLDARVIRAANEEGGETNITTGWHAIEFLLWGQDLVPGPGGGSRSHLDYADGGGTAANEARRRQYLKVVVAMLVADLESVRQAWSPESRLNFPAWLSGLDPPAALSKIMSGVATLAFGELRGERLVVPFTTKDKENEHSCFSDTTHLDHLNDMIGIRNVWEGRYTSSSGKHDQAGPGLRDLAAVVDPRVAEEIDVSISECLEALSDPRLSPFEAAMQGHDGAPGRQAIQEAIERLNLFTRSFLFLASRMDVRISSSLRK